LSIGRSTQVAPTKMTGTAADTAGGRLVDKRESGPASSDKAAHSSSPTDRTDTAGLAMERQDLSTS
jgi:hypothetical protein